MKSTTLATLAAIAGLQLISGAALSQVPDRSPEAQEAQEARAAAPQKVEISATRDPEFKPYRTMLKGVDAFDEFHKLAPLAPLRFILRPESSSVSLDGATLNISSANLSLPIEIDEGGRFILQRNKQAFDENADIVTNKKKNTLRWKPDIHTPDLPPNTRRLGDLRLECAIRWAVEKDELSFVKRNMFRLAGGACTSAMISVLSFAPRPLVSATAVSGERRMELFLASGKMAYVPPLHDATWNDETLLELVYADAVVAAAK